MTLDGESWDAACRWAFQRTFRRKPALDELRDYQRALAERDATGAKDALPIYARLRAEASPAPAKARPERVIEPTAPPAAPPSEPPESEPPKPETPQPISPRLPPRSRPPEMAGRA